VRDLKLNTRFDAILTEFGKHLRRAIPSHCPRGVGLQVDDVMQEASIRLWRALASGTEIHDFPSYLHRVAVSVTIDAVRRIKTRQEEQMPLPAEPTKDPVPEKLVF
jgi:DNA-directed RNA polymerase specialized sigma24 family protein